MRGFILMLSFFTRIPIGKWVNYSESLYENSLVTFPLVGFVCGAFLALPTMIPGINGELKAILCIVAYIAVTGGIHLDGLADSCDGLFSNRPKERVLEIMKDSHIGTFGVIALILYFFCFYTSSALLDWKWLFMMPFVGKSLGFFSAGFSHYARSEMGMGFVFIEKTTKLQGALYLIVLFLMVTLILGSAGIIAAFIALISTAWLMYLSSKTIGGQTGDTIGFIIELSQMVFLLTGAYLY